MLSRLAGLSLHWFARVGTRDATNSFKAYNAAFVREVGIESDAGFELGIEMVAKARRRRLPVAEVPTIWLDRGSRAVELQGRRRGSPATSAGTATRSARASPSWPHTSRSGSTSRNEVERESRSVSKVSGERVVRFHRRLRRRRSCSVAGTKSSASTTTRSTAASSHSYDDHPAYHARRRRRPRRRPDDRAARGLRPLHRRRRDDRRHLVLPHLRLRPPRDQRAHHRGVVRRRDPRASRPVGSRRSRTSARRWCSSRRRRGRRTKGRSGRSRRRCRRTASRSSRSSTSRAPRATSTACRTRSCGRSTASASARHARSARSRC